MELSNGDALQVAAATALPVGPVALLEKAEHAATYRLPGPLSFGAAAAGTLVDLRGRRGDLIASLQVIALTATVLGATPPLAAQALR